jgi:dTDP-4-amino-4,6-dideoxygalactose transaminase
LTDSPAPKQSSGTATETAPSEHPGEAAARALRIPITKPTFGEAEKRAILEPLESGWVVQGPRVQEFERRFGDYVGTGNAVATTSCTTALHLAVAVLGLKPGDEVLVPAFTWVSTANVVEYMGATPRFCDVDLRTFNVDPARFEEEVGPNTVGMIPVHLFGLCAEMDAVNAIARKHGLWVIEDAACAFGAWQDDHHAGTLSDIGAFSFHPRKSITTGEGGMLTTDVDERAELARTLREHGGDRSDLARHETTHSFLLAGFDHLGYNYRMTDLQGALGCAQMDRADGLLEDRRRLAGRYDEALVGVDWLTTPTVPEGNVHGYQSYVCLYGAEPSMASLEELNAARNDLMLRLERRGIATRQGTHAPVATRYYSRKYGLREEEFPAAVLAERLSLALPLYPGMSDAEQDLVVEELLAAHDEA